MHLHITLFPIYKPERFLRICCSYDLNILDILCCVAITVVLSSGSINIIFIKYFSLFLIGLTIDQDTNTLYWVNSDKHSIQSYSIQDSRINPSLNLPEESFPSSIALYKNNIYYVDNRLMNIRVANKITGDDNSIFRNITGGNILLSKYI